MNETQATKFWWEISLIGSLFGLVTEEEASDVQYAFDALATN